MATFSKTKEANFKCRLTALLPLKEAMKRLCFSQTTPIRADRIILALLESVRSRDSPLTQGLRAGVLEQIRIRRSEFSSLLQYLLDPAYHSLVELALVMSPE